MMNNVFGNNVGGYAPAYPQQPVKSNQLLTDDQIRVLQQSGQTKENFFNSMTQIDVLKSMCTHKANGRSSVFAVQDGSDDYQCSICGARFKLLYPGTDISQTVKDVKSIIESIKFWYGEIDPDTGGKVYPALAACNQLDNMWKVASDYSSRSYNGVINNQYYNNANSDYNTISQYAQMFGFGNGMQTQWAQPQPGMMPQQPVMPQMQQPGMMPQQPVMPQMQQPGMMPQMPQQPVVPQQPGMMPQQQVGSQQQYTPAGVPAYEPQGYAGASNPIGNVVVGTQPNTGEKKTENVSLNPDNKSDFKG